MITSQNDTAPKPPVQVFVHDVEFDYQSERHCSKTLFARSDLKTCLITSQNDTAPKLSGELTLTSSRLITSQNDTAPKPEPWPRARPGSLITSQNDTAPKR